MLREIRIRDLGVIESATLELGPGLTVLTGETGAGKTMVVTALSLLLGARAESGLVRSGAPRLVVEGIVALPPTHPVVERAEEAGGECDDEGLVLVRSVSAEGRSRAHLGGRSVPVGLLAEVGERLVALHGQADQWRLRQPDQHRELLDGAGGPEMGRARATYESRYAAHAAAQRELTTLREQARERAQEATGLRVGLERIEAVDPQPGEDDALRLEDDRLTHADLLRSASRAAQVLLTGDIDDATDDGGALAAIARARATLEAAAEADPALTALAERLVEIGHLTVELGHDLTGYLADIDLDPGRHAWVQQRRAAIADLTRVYGDDVDAVLDWAREAAARVADLDGTDDRVAALTAQVHDLERQRADAAADLTRLRETQARTVQASITDELSHLAMPSAVVEVTVRPTAYGPHGADEVEILLAANSGAEPRSVARAASGGELSRVMLAIEVAGRPDAVPGQGEVPTFVFDEVDAGVGGSAALDVGARLAALARHAQVVVVTHLAQVAAHADRHLVVRKADDGQVTTSGVVAVEGPERVAELARMLGGRDTEAALGHARELLETAHHPASGGDPAGRRQRAPARAARRGRGAAPGR